MSKKVKYALIAVPACLYLIMFSILAVDLWTMRNAVKIQGEVVGFDSYVSTSHDEHGTERTTMYAPTVAFGLNGGEYLCQSKVYSSSRSYDSGEVVKLLVDPANPKKCKMTAFFDRFLAEFILFCIASVFAFVIGLVIYFNSPHVEFSGDTAAYRDKILFRAVLGLFIAIGPILGLIGALQIYNENRGIGIFLLIFAILWSYGVYSNMRQRKANRG